MSLTSTETCVEQQLCELEMLMSMYSKDELILDSDCAPYIEKYCEQITSNDSTDGSLSNIIAHEEEMSLGFTLKLVLDSHPVEIKCDLPKPYPTSSSPSIFVRTSGIISRQNQSKFRLSLDDHISNLELGEVMLLSILDWINEHLPCYIETTQMSTEPKTPTDSPCSFTRMWIYSHHIYSKFKRRDIIAWANELRLHGFSMCGKPGIVCIEGYTEDVEEYWARLRRLNWKRLVMKEREDTQCSSHSILQQQYRFEPFEEKVFGSRPGRGSSSSFHSDIGELRVYLQEHQCSNIFEIYFGVDGGSLEEATAGDT